MDLIIRFRSGAERIHDLKQQVREELELVFGRPVQLASEKYLKPYYRQNILRDVRECLKVIEEIYRQS